MKKIRTWLIIFLTIGCIALTGLLPGIAGRIQDKQILNRVGYSQSSQVELQIREDMRPLDKLRMFTRRTALIEIPSSLARMTPEEAEQAAKAALEPYMDLGLMPEFAPDVYEIRSMLIQTEDQTGLTGIIWSISLTGSPEGDPYVGLDLDDATGKLLRLYFSWENWDRTDQDTCLTQFADVYFTGIDLPDYAAYAVSEPEIPYAGEYATVRRFRFGDAVNGDLTVDLCIYPFGFYLNLPER